MLVPCVCVCVCPRVCGTIYECVFVYVALCVRHVLCACKYPHNIKHLEREREREREEGRRCVKGERE